MAGQSLILADDLALRDGPGMKVRVTVDVHDDAGRRIGKRTEWRELSDADLYATPTDEIARRIMAGIAIVAAMIVGWLMFG